ncbi:MAG TPA: putative Ig domain-containing protein, partial [Candidatus Glassbacteria bacterium]|nr:putative Ig domain-containing protein [Candidatus Glassbacteria bacterium]
MAAGTPITLQLTRKDAKAILVPDTSFTVQAPPNNSPVFVDPGAQSGQMGLPVQLILEATDADGDALTYRLISGPESGATLDEVTGIFNWTPSAGGEFTAVFEVSDGRGADSLTVNFDILAGNLPPKWYASADTLVINEGSVFTLTFDAPTDVNLGDVVTVSIGTLPAGASFNTLSRTFSWTPGYEAAGVYQFVLTAADQDEARGYFTVIVIVTDVNQPPVLSVSQESFEVDEGTPVSFSAIAADPDLDEIEYSITVTPEAEGWEFVAGVFTWQQTVAGEYLVTITAGDGRGSSDVVQVSLTVSSVNRPPVFDPVADVAVDAGAQVQITLSATDPDNDPLSYSIVLANETSNILTRGASLSANVFTWTPAATDLGQNLATFKVADPDGASDLATVRITVTGRNITAPVAFEAFEEQIVTEGSALIYRLPLSDSTSWTRSQLLFWARDLPEGAVFDAAAGAITWTPGLLQAGGYTLTCGVNDGNFQDTKKLKISVLEKDIDPVLTPIGNLSVSEGSLLSVTFEAEDASGESISFSASGLPSGAKLFARGLLTYKPGYDTDGVYPVTITVTDASGNTDQETLNLTVVDVNRRPELDVSNQKTDEARALNFTVKATDPDSDPLTLTAGNLPTGASFNASSGAFSWTPTLTQSGNYTVLFTASDGKAGGVDSANVVLSVGNVNLPPEIDRLAPVTASEGQPLTITITASDPDRSDGLTITASGLPSGASLRQTGTNPATGTISFTPGYRTQGVYNVKVQAVDNDVSDPL